MLENETCGGDPFSLLFQILAFLLLFNCFTILSACFFFWLKVIHCFYSDKLPFSHRLMVLPVQQTGIPCSVCAQDYARSWCDRETKALQGLSPIS